MSTYPSTVIFAIDALVSLDEVANHSAFQQAMKDKGASFVIGAGSYEGLVEACYIMSEANFNRFVLNCGWVLKQESVLHVSGCNKQYATLRFLERSRSALYTVYGREESLGSMQQVSQAVAQSYPSWTYNTFNKAWYITAHRNPDHSKEILPYGTRPAKDYYADDMDVKDGDMIECAANIGSPFSFTLGKQYKVAKATAQSLTRVVDDHGVARISSARFKYTTQCF